MATPKTGSIVKRWLRDIDPILDRYLEDFTRLDFSSTNSLKFFSASDFALFRVPVSAVHRRMILNGVAKLQTPQSKLGWDSENVEESVKNKETALKPRQLDFCGDKVQELESNTFMYKSPGEQ